MTAVRTMVKIRNGHSFILSATVPETIEAAVATKTIWKNQSDWLAYPLPVTAATISADASSALIKANSASDGL